ncbi:DUF2971 domain-containing protein [Wenyingzhuangia sp. chi5]|uniref:DUF2971 domain-containing protein n=1 Tax=Wenyingzhuangia gilva TaxID=3057677 RepID=A0ABT8VVJ3_9FLAO|nr:DUF2971 domain-containing protein [Wenyingzhuangia sp. chi5]MDO3695994.1 DUF2971 domain-containing protein [Wenyingzhuangia sp. chi5]
MNILQEIDNVFADEKIVYHYTKTQTAFEHILHSNHLKLSIRKTSIDPIENIINPIITNYITENNSITNEEQNEISEFVTRNLKNIRQVCFCKNDQNININNSQKIPYEYYGFMKPRMWDQYGDKYNGVCLAFDIEKLKKNNPEIESNNIEYISYHDFKKDIFSIEHSEVKEIGMEKYCEKILSNMKKYSFLKHQDYSGENEYRFISLDKNYLNIKDSLKAIIVSERNLSPFARQQLENFAEINNIKYFQINWESSGVRISSLENLQSIRNFYKQIKR